MRRLKNVQNSPQIQALIEAERQEEQRHAAKFKGSQLPKAIVEALRKGIKIEPRIIPSATVCIIDLMSSLQALSRVIPMEQLQR